MKQYLKHIGLIFSVMLAILISVHGQSIDDSREMTSQYTEALTFFTDRHLYLSGERIWFYAQLNSKQEPLLSKTLYLEVYNKDQSIRKKISIEEGFCSGLIEIPKDFNSNGYLIRAYTRYMRNFLPEQYAYQFAFIVNPSKGLTKNGTYEFDTSQYDEGNAFLNALIPNVDAAQVKTKLNPIDKVTIGRWAGNYRFTFKIDRHKTQYENLNFILRNSRFEQILHQQGLENGVLFPEKDITPGINYFMIRTDSTPLVAGVLFQQARLPGQLRLDTEKKSYTQREKVNLSFSGYSEQLKNRKSLVCAARKGTRLNSTDTAFVYKMMALNPYLLNSYHQMFPELGPLPRRYMNLALKNHVKSLISSPGFLKRLSKPVMDAIPEIYDLSLSGFVTKKDDNSHIENCPIYLSLFGEKPQLHVYETRQNGSFLFNIENATGLQDAYLVTNYMQKEPVKVLIESDFSPDFHESKIPNHIDTSYQELLKAMYMSYQVNQQFASTDSLIRSVFEPLPFLIKSTEMVRLSDYIKLPNMTEVFREIVSDAYVRKRNGIDKIMVYDGKRDMMYNDPLILLDNIPVFDDQKILSLPVSEIKNINVMTDPWYIGSRKYNGIIAIQSKNKDFAGMEFKGNSVFLQYKTYTPEARFEQQLPEKMSLPYFTNLLYWQVSDTDNLNKFFQTSDDTGPYEILWRIVGESASEQYFGKQVINLSK